MVVAVEAGIPELLNGVGKGVEPHVEKLDSEIRDFLKLLVTRTLTQETVSIYPFPFITCFICLMFFLLNKTN